MVFVDYTRSFMRMVLACLGHEKVCDTVPETYIGTMSLNFPLAYASSYFPLYMDMVGTGRTIVEVAIFDFGDECILEADIRSAMEAEGYRCARVEELLAFGEASPEEQKVKAIVALGTRFQGGSRTQSVAYLYVSSGKRYLGEYAQPIAVAWNPGFRFLGVRM